MANAVLSTVLFLFVFGVMLPLFAIYMYYREEKRRQKAHNEFIAKLRKEQAERVFREMLQREMQRRMEYARWQAATQRRRQPPKGNSVTWYEFLGVSPNASREEINKAYKNKAKTMHPDMGGSQRDMANLNKAREMGLARR